MSETQYDEVRRRVRGPIIPLPTPFTEDFEVDYEGLGRYVDHLASNGAGGMMTTVGTSRFNLLDKAEMLRINDTVLQAAAGRCLTIVSTPMTGSTRQCIEFGQRAKAAGADILLVYHPERHYGDDTLFGFFNDIADAVDIALMIHEMPMRNGLGGGQMQYSVSLLNRLLDEIPNVIGMKEEALDWNYSGAVLKATAGKAAIVGAGGGMSRYLRDYWHGARAFLSGIANFAPALENEFFEAMLNENFKRAHEIVYTIEAPFFQALVPVGWHIALKECLHVAGLMQPHERPPLRRVLPEQRAIVRSVMEENGWAA